MRLLGLVLAFWGWSVAVAWAQEILPNDPAIEDTIGRQIEAFREDDFAKGFEFAAPAIQRMFRTPENFGAMVKGGYPMVWRPQELRFGALRSDAGGLWQRVIVTDAQGQRYWLDYRMELLDGAWRIAAVQLVPAPEPSV